MNEVQTIATVLLLLRLNSVIFIALVLRKQWKLFSYQIDSGLQTFRAVMFTLAVIILFGNIAPIIIDVATIIAPESRPTMSPLGVMYAFSNAITSVASSVVIWVIYKLATQEAIDEEDQRRIDETE